MGTIGNLRRWLVEETETGQLDGYYGTKGDAEEAAAIWEARRPYYTHNVREQQLDDPEMIEDARFLPIAWANEQLRASEELESFNEFAVSRMQ